MMCVAQAEDSDTAAYLLAETLPAAALGQITYYTLHALSPEPHC